MGEDQGAHHPGGGTGDGEEDEVDADDSTAHWGFFCVCVCVSKQPCFGLDRSEKQSLRRAWLKGMFQRWAGNIFMLFTRHDLRYRFELAACGSMDVSDALTCCICRYPERLKERQRQPARRPLRRSKLWVDLKHEYNSHFYWRLLDLASVCVKVVAWVLSYKPRRVLNCLCWCVCVISSQAERIMEALELYKEENRKMEEHKYACQTAEKEVETWDHPIFFYKRCFLILEEWGVELNIEFLPLNWFPLQRIRAVW